MIPLRIGVRFRTVAFGAAAAAATLTFFVTTRPALATGVVTADPTLQPDDGGAFYSMPGPVTYNGLGVTIVLTNVSVTPAGNSVSFVGPNEQENFTASALADISVNGSPTQPASAS